MTQENLEQKRDAFRNYLKQAGAIDTLTKALIKLYEEPKKPEDAVKFIRKNMCESCPDDEQFQILQADLEEANKKIVELQKEIVILKGNVKHTESKTNVLLTKGYEELTADEDCNSMLKKYLTEEVFEELQEQTTELKCTLLDCINSGLENHDSSIGVYAPDAESYDVFASLFDPIIEEYHGFDSEAVQPASDWGDASLFVDVDPAGEFVQSTRVRCGRSLEGVPFNPCMTQENYMETMEKVKNVLMGLGDDLKGTFYPLEGMSEDDKKTLIESHVLFKEGDRFLKAAGASRFWAHGRGIFMNDLKTFIVWINEEDHLRIISMESSGNLAKVYERLSRAVAEISRSLSFSRHERLGFLTFCPTNLGTTIRASVHIKLPKLSADKIAFEKLAKKHFLQIRGTAGEHSESEEGVYDISNKKRLGLTEFEAVKQLQDGISELIKLEKEFIEPA